MINSIDHIIIAVKDLAKAEEEYSVLLGRKAAWRGEHPGLGSSNCIFRLANTYLELVAATSVGDFATLITAHITENGEGLLGVAFGTLNLDNCKAQLSEQGIGVGDINTASAQSEDGQTRSWRMAMLDGEAMNGLFAFLIEPEDTLALPFSQRLAAIDGRATVDALDHLVIETSDTDDFIRRYSKQMGLKLLLDQTIEKWGVRQLFYRVGGVTLEVISKIDSEEQQADNLWGLAYRAPDIGKLQQRLQQSGVDISELRVGRKKGTTVATPKSNTLNIASLFIGPQTQSPD